MPFKIVRNDITKVKADIIVNTANPNPICVSGTDLAIYEAAGKEKLLAERANIGKIARGDIAVTGAYSLNAKYIIHTVGPVWTDGLHHEFEILEDCYRKSLQKALELKCDSIAFPFGSSKVNLNKYPERESNLFHVLRVGLPTICNTESENQELTFDKLFVYYASKGITLNKRTFKKNLGFLLDNGKYNMLAQLMSDNSGIPIRFAIFKGKDKTSTMYSVREFGNTCLLMSLDKVLEYGGVLNVPQADERERIVERKEIPLFDEEAFREAMINAFVHNQWTTGNAPMITAFSDRIEILSRGTIPPGQTMEGFFAGESVPVNQKLSDMLLQLHISERTGRGVPKITEVYGKGTYEFRENSIVVSIPFTRVSTEDEDPRWTQDRTQDRTQDGTQEDSKGSSEDEKIKRILEFCQTPKGILEITEMLGYSGRKPTKKYVKPLVEQGRLAMTIPDKPQSKNQKYVTVK